METMKSIRLFILTSAFLCVLCVSALILAGCVGTYFTFDKAREVQLGMTAAQVQKIMGKPFIVSTRGDDEIWVYSFADGWGAARSVSFILRDGKVTDVPHIPDSFGHKAGTGKTG